MNYQQRIASLTNANPRHVEAFMRVEHNTLDKFSAQRFASEVEFAAICVREAGPEMAEKIAASFGLVA